MVTVEQQVHYQEIIPETKPNKTHTGFISHNTISTQHVHTSWLSNKHVAFNNTYCILLVPCRLNDHQVDRLCGMFKRVSLPLSALLSHSQQFQNPDSEYFQNCINTTKSSLFTVALSDHCCWIILLKQVKLELSLLINTLEETTPSLFA